jgi:NAD dependent epimerase/dehydratase family enzyme
MRAQDLGVRVVRLRIGIVLAIDGGALSRMLTPFEFGLGGPFGAGRHWMSWIHLDDLVRLIAHAIATPGLEGALNGTAPEPVRNAAFAPPWAAPCTAPPCCRPRPRPCGWRWAPSPTNCC